MPDPIPPEFSIVQVSVDELIVRLLEGYWNTPRPKDTTAQQIIDNLEPAEFDRMKRMAIYAIDYIISAHVDAVGEDMIRVMRPGDQRH